jgi:peroxiredoxin
MKSKKVVILSIILLIVGLPVFLLYKTVREKQQIKDAYNSIPDFKMTDLQGGIYTSQLLNNNKSTLFLFFDPDCENCREEFEQIKQYRDSLQDCNMVFVSILSRDDVQKFICEMNFQLSENMAFLLDSQAKLFCRMDVRIIPATLIYNRNSVLIKRYSGQVKAETLIKYLSE